MSQADDLIQRLDRLAAERSVWDDHWQEIAERVLPRQADFNSRNTAGDKRTDKIFDSTAALALDRFASAMESMLTPRSSRWHSLRFASPALEEDDTAKRWLEQVTDLLFRVRYGPFAAFASNLHEAYVSLGAFGTQVIYTEEGFDRAPIHYRALHIGECFLETDFTGRVDTVYRRFELSARQAAQKWGEQKLSPKLSRALEKDSDADQQFAFLHAVQPAAKEGRRAFDSWYVEIESRHIVHSGGYYEMPYHVSRFATTPRETYGRGPAMFALPDIKMLNEMAKTTLRAAQKMVDLPLGIYTDGVMGRPNLNPGALNPGGVNAQGQEMIRPIGGGGRPDIGLDMMERRRQAINEGFWVTLFQILVDSPAMTATEVLERAQEKAQLLGPAVGRQQSELLGPLIEREVAILGRKGLLPEPPPHIAGEELEIDYTSPLARMQRAEEGVGTLRTLEALQAVAPAKPEVFDNLDADATVRGLAEINGMPLKFLRPLKDVTASRKSQQAEAAQAGQMQALMGMADAAGKAAPAVQALKDAGDV